MTGLEDAVIAAACGGVLGLVGQRWSDRSGRRERERSAAIEERDEVRQEIAGVKTTLAYHGGLLEMLCHRFGVRPRVVRDEDRERLRDEA